MDLELSEEQQELQTSVRAVLERERPATTTRMLSEERPEAASALEALWALAVELDWPALTVAEADGGVGLGPVELCVLAEELGHALAPGPLYPTVAQFVPAIQAAGDAAQVSRFCGAVAREGRSGTLAVAEASGSFTVDALTGAAGMATVAVPEPSDTAEGGWTITGEKHWVVEAQRIDEIVVVARIAAAGVASDAGAVGLFVVPADSVGLRLAAVSSLDASRELCTVAFDGVRVGADRALTGGRDSGISALRDCLETATMAQAAETVGVCQAIIEIVLEHVKTREQFDVKIGSFQAVKHKLADMYVAIESARAITRFAAAAIAENDDRRTLATHMAKSSAADCQRLVATEGIQSLGGIGYTWEHDMHLYVKRAKSGGALLGTGAAHRARIAELIGM